MRYLTDRKRAVGKGAGHSGTEHHWYMQISSVALAFLLPVWVYIFGHALGQGHEAVVATFARPFPAIVTALILVVAMRHFAKGAHDHEHCSATDQVGQQHGRACHLDGRGGAVEKPGADRRPQRHEANMSGG